MTCVTGLSAFTIATKKGGPPIATFSRLSGAGGAYARAPRDRFVGRIRPARLSDQMLCERWAEKKSISTRHAPCSPRVEAVEQLLDQPGLGHLLAEQPQRRGVRNIVLDREPQK